MLVKTLINLTCLTTLFTVMCPNRAFAVGGSNGSGGDPIAVDAALIANKISTYLLSNPRYF